jgi:8-oxo-dGTP pyrophosphatase MutT (NUDIX family)
MSIPALSPRPVRLGSEGCRGSRRCPADARIESAEDEERLVGSDDAGTHRVLHERPRHENVFEPADPHGCRELLGALEDARVERVRGKLMPWRREVSAGGVVYRRVENDVDIALASRRTRRGQLAWGLPKGGIEEEEDDRSAALREVREETGLEAEIEADLGDIRYFYVWEGVRVRKVVHFFLMRVTGGDISLHDHEMEEVRWFSLADALRKAAYKGEREILERAAARLT